MKEKLIHKTASIGPSTWMTTNDDDQAMYYDMLWTHGDKAKTGDYVLVRTSVCAGVSYHLWGKPRKASD